MSEDLANDIRDAVSVINDPHMGVSIVEMGIVQSIAIDGSTAELVIRPTNPGCMSVTRIAAQAKAEALKVEGIDKVKLIIEGLGLGFLLYLIYVLVCVYIINGARGFWAGFWQGFVILSIMNLIDRFLVDDYWVGHTNAWIIPGTEDLRPYITAKDKKQKWIMGTVGMAIIAALLSGVMTLIL